jgi:hypothetical protein
VSRLDAPGFTAAQWQRIFALLDAKAKREKTA